MVALKSPATTIETATALNLSTAASSEQITKLWRSGCLDRTRIGRRVFYALNTKGKALLAALES
jgi:DNA-binding MarR family transcriptional regulator